MRAVAESGGLRVWFRCLKPIESPRSAVLEADNGTLREITLAPDGGAVSALWLKPRGELRCRFPNGGLGSIGHAFPGDAHDVDYTFVTRSWGNVTARVPRGCPMKPILILRVFVDPKYLPGELRLPGGKSAPLTDPVSVHVLDLPRDQAGRLRGGEQMLELRAKSERTAMFLVGVDADGTPTATSGYVQNW